MARLEASLASKNSMYLSYLLPPSPLPEDFSAVLTLKSINFSSNSLGLLLDSGNEQLATRVQELESKLEDAKVELAAEKERVCISIFYVIFAIK